MRTSKNLSAVGYQRLARSNTGFTLIELLTVIAIIAILAGLLFPAIQSSLKKADVTKARNAIANLSTGVRAYYTEYGKWPSTTAGALYFTTNLLSNPRNIVFQEFPVKDLDTAGTYGAAPNVAYLDPWGRPYRVAFDVTYQNSVANPFSGGTPNPVSAGFIIWSCGPDATCSDSKPASGGGSGAASTDKDNITSW